LSTRYVWERYNTEKELAKITASSAYVGSAEYNTDWYVAVANESALNISNGIKASQYTIRSATYSASIGTVGLNAGECFSDIFNSEPSGPVDIKYQASESAIIRPRTFTDEPEKDFYVYGEIYILSTTRVKGDNFLGTVSNASASTYPRHNYTGQITSICAIIPVLLRRYKHVA